MVTGFWVFNLVFGIFVPEVSGALAKLPSAYLRIDEDGLVTLLSGKVEYGQGVMTSLAQMAAEELDVPLSSMHAGFDYDKICKGFAIPANALWIRMAAPTVHSPLGISVHPCEQPLLRPRPYLFNWPPDSLAFPSISL